MPVYAALDCPESGEMLTMSELWIYQCPHLMTFVLICIRYIASDADAFHLLNYWNCWSLDLLSHLPSEI